MVVTSLRWFFSIFIAFQALSANALIALPDCAGDEAFSFGCEPVSDPNSGATGALVGNAIIQKLIAHDPQLALPLLSSNFLQDWIASWQNFPVPAAVESLINGLGTDDFDQWLNLLCFNLHPNSAAIPLVNLQEMPQLVVSSFPQVAGSAVPLPASIWLFVSAILGLAVGGKHRKQ